MRSGTRPPEGEDAAGSAEETERAERLERLLTGLVRGRRLRLSPRDARDRAAIQFAAQLVAARHLHPRPTFRFRRRLGRLLAPSSSTPILSRRSALVAGAGALAGVLTGTAAGRWAWPPTATGPAVRVRPGAAFIDPYVGRWVDVAALADLPEGEGVPVQAGAVLAYVVRRGLEVWAVSGICSHLPCDLDWNAERGLLVCPCHNRAFSPTGLPQPSPYPLPPLSKVRARVVDGRVQVLGT